MVLLQQNVSLPVGQVRAKFARVRKQAWQHSGNAVDLHCLI